MLKDCLLRKGHKIQTPTSANVEYPCTKNELFGTRYLSLDFGKQRPHRMGYDKTSSRYLYSIEVSQVKLFSTQSIPFKHKP